jgi:hypothetical protein
MMSGGCGGASLDNAQESPAALARAVLEALGRGDREALRRLALDEREFREIVWPELPASRPERNLPLEYVWTDLRTKSESALAQTLQVHGGKRYELLKVGFTGETSQYRSFLVQREALLELRDDSGRPQSLRLFGSVIQKDGRFKVFSYVVD